ncbi:hypothetical protein A5784_25270 [Mycobacterium sp. 852013-50091_SCH5140682]|nr:hypothetical protein A5784_25270 [Mycobacterium sp. 852013-50091_SCH5140682]
MVCGRAGDAWDGYGREMIGSVRNRCGIIGLLLILPLRIVVLIDRCNRCITVFFGLRILFILATAVVLFSDRNNRCSTM